MRATCPKCSLGGYSESVAPDGRPAFSCPHCYHYWTSGKEGGKYASKNLVQDAAPDLLDACKMALGAFDALRVVGADKHLPGFHRVLGKINAAIQKAEGGRQ